jgi:hypothetical protein
MSNAVVSKSLQSRLDKHFVACAAAAAVVGAFGTENADAAVQYSGPQNIAVNPLTPAGIYINVDGFTSGVVGSTVAGWDMNIFNINFTSGGKGVFLYTTTARPFRAIGTNGGLYLPPGGYGYVSKLGAGAAIGPAGPFIAPTPSGFPYPFFVYSDPSGAYPLPGGTNWAGGVTGGFMGFRFTAADNQLHFGWARLNIGTRAQNHAITVVDWAWEDQVNTPIAAGAGIPEPTTACALGLLALGAVGIRPSRKQVA